MYRMYLYRCMNLHLLISNHFIFVHFQWHLCACKYVKCCVVKFFDRSRLLFHWWDKFWWPTCIITLQCISSIWTIFIWWIKEKSVAFGLNPCNPNTNVPLYQLYISQNHDNIPVWTILYFKKWHIVIYRWILTFIPTLTINMLCSCLLRIPPVTRSSKNNFIGHV